MLGASSRALGVQSYSDRPKKSSSFAFIASVMRPRAFVRVPENEAAALTRMVPPR